MLLDPREISEAVITHRLLIVVVSSNSNGSVKCLQ